MVFVVPYLPPLGPEFLPLEPRRAYNHTGAWKPPRLTNLPSRFHESHSSGVPFDICIENLLKDLPGAGAFITGREAWTGLRGVDSAPGKPTSPHISRDRLRDFTRYDGTLLRA